MPRKYEKKEPKCTDDHIINLAAEEVINEKKSVLQTARKYNITQVALRKCIRLIRGNRKKFTYSHETLQAAIRHLSEKKLPLSWVSKHYGIPRSTLSARLKSDCPFERKITGKGTALPKAEEEAIKKWILETGKKEGTQAWQTIAKTVQEVLNERGLKVFKNNNKPTSGWLQAFLRRHPELRKIRIGYWTTGIVGEMNREEESRSHSRVKDVIPQLDDNEDIDSEEEKDFEFPECIAKGEISIKAETSNSQSPVENADPLKIQLSDSNEIAVPLKSEVNHSKEIKSGLKFEKIEAKIAKSNAESDASGTNIMVIDSSKLSMLKGSRIVLTPTAEGKDSGASKGTTDMLLGLRKITVGRKGVTVNGEIVETKGNDKSERQTCIGKEIIGVGGKGCEKARLEMGSHSLKVKAGSSKDEAGSLGIQGGKLRLGVTATDGKTTDGNSVKILLKGFKKLDSSTEQDKNVFECTDEKVDKFLLVANPKGSSISMTCLVLPKNAKTSPVIVSVVQKVTRLQNVKNISKEEESTEYSNKTPLDSTECFDRAPLDHNEDSKNTPECPTKIPLNSYWQDSNKTNFNQSEKQMFPNLNPEDSDFISLSQEEEDSNCAQLSPLNLLSESDQSFEDSDLVIDLEACGFHVQEPEMPILEKLPKTHEEDMKELPHTNTDTGNEKISNANEKPRIRVKTVSSLMTSTEIRTSCEDSKQIEDILTDPLSVINDSQQEHIGGLEAMYNEENGMDKLLQWSSEGGQPNDPLLCMWERSGAVLMGTKSPSTPPANLLPESDALEPIMEVDETEAKYMYVPDLRKSSNGPLDGVEELTCQMSVEEYMLLQETLWEDDIKPEIEDIKPLPDLIGKKIKPQAVMRDLYHSSTTDDEGEVKLSIRQEENQIKYPCCT